jgi:hypothetical protein
MRSKSLKKDKQTKPAAEATAPKAEAPKKGKAKTKAEAAPKKTAETKAAAPEQPTGNGEPLVVFAFRLTRAERDAIHAAAGPAKASKFVKAVALAAACRDAGALEAAIKEAEASRKS